MTSAEGHITHNTAGRVNVERNADGSITLRLWQWSLKPDATLTRAEAEKLIDKITAALKPARTKAEAFDHESLA